MGSPSRRSIRSASFVVCMLLVLVVVGCSTVNVGKASRSPGETARRPRMSVETSAGGTSFAVTAQGRTLVVSGDKVLEPDGDDLRVVRSVPKGWRIATTRPVGGRIVLMQDSGDLPEDAEPRLALWDPSTTSKPAPFTTAPEGSPVHITDLLGDSRPEVVVVAVERREPARGTTVRVQRLAVWSVGEGGPELAWRSEPVSKSLSGSEIQAVLLDVGSGDGRAELVWKRADLKRGARFEKSVSHIYVTAPSLGFKTIEGGTFREGSLEETGTVAGRPAVLIRHSDPEGRSLLGFRGGVPVPSSARPESLTVECPRPPALRIWGMAPEIVGARHVTEGVSVRRVGTRDAVLVVSASGFVSDLRPSGPVGNVSGFTLADVDGDGREDVVVAGSGEPGICNDTYTGYLGYSKQRADRSFGPIVWSRGLGGGLVSVQVVDIDRDGRSEILAGVIDSFCSGRPKGLHVWRP